MATPWAAISLASLGAALAFAVLVGRRRRYSPPAGPLLGFMVSFAVWSGGEAAARLLPEGTDPAAVLLWIRFEWVGLAFVSATLLHFILVYTGSGLSNRRWVLPAIYGPAALIAGEIALSNGIVYGWAATPFGPSAILQPPAAAYLPGAAWFAALLALGWALLAVAYVRGDREFRRRSLPLLATLTVTNTLGVLTETFWPLLTSSSTGLELDTVYALALTSVLVFAETRLHFLPIVAAREAPRAVAAGQGLESGLAHLFLARTRDPAFRAFRDLATRVPGLCISAVYPPRLQERYSLAATPIVWITNHPSRELSARPTTLEFEVLLSATRFMKDHAPTAILVDDLDYLCLTNGFESVARFLKRLANLAGTHQSTLIACADPDAFTAAQLALLRGVFDRAREFAPPAARTPRPVVDGPGALLLEGPANDALDVYQSLAKPEEGVIVSTKNPERLRRLHGASAPIVWLSEAPEDSKGVAVSVDLDAAKLAVARLGDRLHPVMFVPDLEQLTLVAPFPRALEFLKGLIDQMAARDGVLIASVEPQALAPTQLAALRRRFDRVRSLT